MMRTAVLGVLVALAGCAPTERGEAPPPVPHMTAERPAPPARPVTTRPAVERPAMQRPAPVTRPGGDVLDFGDEWRRCDQYDPLFVQAAQRHFPWGAKGIGARWLKAQTIKESSCRPEVCSEDDACGLMQHLPGTAADLGMTDRHDPAQSIEGGARYDAWLYGQWRAYDRTVLQRIRLMLDNYFRGLGRTLKDQETYGCVLWAPCFAEHAPPLTVDYVTSISALAGYPVDEGG